MNFSPSSTSLHPHSRGALRTLREAEILHRLHLADHSLSGLRDSSLSRSGLRDSEPLCTEIREPAVHREIPAAQDLQQTRMPTLRSQLEHPQPI